MKYLIPFTFLLLLLSCDNNEVVIDLPSQEPKLVFKSIATNNELWESSLSTSTDILKPFDQKEIKNAIVNLYEDNMFLETLNYRNYDGPNGAQYQASTAKPRPGKTYRIEANASPYKPIIAQYTQPMPVMAESLKVKVLGTNFNYEKGIDVKFKVGFTDPPEANYYEILIVRDTDDRFNSGRQFYLEFTDPSYKYPLPSCCARPNIFDDSYFNGKNIVFEFDSYLDNPEDEIKTCTVFIRTLSKELYQYLKTSQLQRDTQGDAFAQPVKVENNIQNGFGIFGGFTQTQKTFEFP